MHRSAHLLLAGPCLGLLSALVCAGCNSQSNPAPALSTAAAAVTSVATYVPQGPFPRGAAPASSVDPATVGPVLSVLSPARGATTDQAVVDVRIQADDPDGVRGVTVEGLAAQPTGTAGNVWLASVPLQPGFNLLHVESSDALGNVSKSVFSVTQGTFEAMLATPITVGELVAGEILWGGIKATFGAVAVLTIISLFGLVPSLWALGALPLAFLTGLLFTATAMCVTSVSKSYESFNYYFTLAIAPMFLFSGIFFPLDRAPGWAQHLAAVMPLTHVVYVSRALIRGTPSWAMLGHLAVVVGFLVAGSFACSALMRRRLRV